MNNKNKIKGIIRYSLYDKKGNLKQEGISKNIVTTQGNTYYVDRLASVGGGTAKIFVLGTGNASVGSTDTWVSGYYANNGTAAGTGGAVTVGQNSGTSNSLQYIGTFGAGYGTVADPITRIGITNMDASADGNGTPNGTSTYFIAHGTVTPSVTKGATDTLVVTWDHLFEGS